MPSSTTLDAAAVAPDPRALALQHQDLVRILAARLYKQRWSDEVPFDDYLQSGMVGLLEAAGRFEPQRGFRFATFATPRIVGSILNSLEAATERNRQLAAARQHATERAQALSDTAPPDDGTPEAALARIADIAIGLAVGFMLEGSALYSDGSELTQADGYRSLASQQAGTLLHNAIERLTGRHREIIEMHYFQHVPFITIAERFNLTKGRISQLHHEALVLLKSGLGLHFSDFEA